MLLTIPCQHLRARVRRIPRDRSNHVHAHASQPAQQAITDWCQEALDDGEMQWSAWNDGLDRLRAAAANLINAETTEIALLPNTTAGVSLVAESFPWRSGDNVVTLADEFPSNLYSWMNLASVGVETR